ncbi:hypothetical protein [Desulfoluna butyratoxydans]|uniref:Uncharacterized protein n=1 Tax=Desulfoluna butyratoxydans TaxID=231438 RepID=A0A4U8YSW5_9BACT|nr:hypothetical protein [Desulfoluna butyratoxydans]VFQ47485.1 hypothetical protein MSL71_51850 [Desulfoluna butyratoxydans]
MTCFNQVTRTILSTAAVLLGAAIFSTQASAHVFDFMHGQRAVPGSDLYALGEKAMDRKDGKVSYFTNGKGRVLKVLATRGDNGTLRVTVQRVYIPRNYIAETHNETARAEKLYDRLSRVAGSSQGKYALLTDKDGMAAYQYGKAVAEKLDSEK